ncbi:DUF3618 domain-containing protein [Microbacterium sp. 10M-3C3]|jgi:ElaB/YqjD/DUF883 family membrane-anchored ribosome-binding protein|uniref:DUF3618 domain-containing protein n=1 Tax=Microbacterium sp. 10M-3C3 TaxID=2483401 RepID=UPI000F6301F6|nr:DUF3618 domain-containing protein [Microbacterium sp. 10M-3C3]
MSESPEQIRAEIDRTRGELSSDVDALADKVTPSKIVQREKNKITGGLRSIRERIMGAADDAGSSIADHGASVASGIGDAGRTVADKAQGNPLAVGLIAFGVGLVAASLIPASSREKDAAETLKERAQPLVHEAADAAKEVGQHLKEPAQEAASAVKDRAAEAVSEVKDEASGAASDIADRTREARENVTGQA